MKRIHLELHKEGNSLMLEPQDIYEYVGEETSEDLDLAYYLDKWCKLLNWFVGGLHNPEMKFSDQEYSSLCGWVDGYNFAKKYDVTYKENFVEIKTRKHLIVIDKPFDI